jgi:charged multivesicular body protein 3
MVFSFVISGVQSLARELVSSRRVVDRLYANRAQLNSISMHLGESVGNSPTLSLSDSQ